MSTVAEVKLWGSTIGAVAMPDDSPAASFQYDPRFLESRVEVSPLMMPLRHERYTFPALDPQSFRGLPGLLSDSLPDSFGTMLTDIWLAGAGRDPESVEAVQRLQHVGRGGMGALEYAPTRAPFPTAARNLRLAELLTFANGALSHSDELIAGLREGQYRREMRDLLSVGGSVGGARAKAVIAWNPLTGTVRSGRLKRLLPGFEHWLLKFDGIARNRDRDAVADPQGYGAVEYAYSLMARDAGIVMSDTRLLEENGRRHFMTRRFDRGADGSKRHMQSLAGLAHLDFDQPGAHSYEQVLALMRKLGLSSAEVEQMFRRMAFNVAARNQDDHVKNIAFLMDRAGRWRLAPAFDLTFAHQPESVWTGRHQLTINGKREGFTLADFRACERTASLPRGRSLRILDDVRAVVSQWASYAARAGVQEERAEHIASALRLSFADV